MSTAAVSSNSIYQQLQQYFQQRRSDLQQLGKDIKSGDLSDAQQEYQALQTLGSIRALRQLETRFISPAGSRIFKT